jgi:HK97 family phage portal protein
MTILDRIKSIFNLRMGNRPSLRDPALTAFYGGAVSSAGVQVSESSALSYAPFWQAVRIISETISSLPFHVYQQTSSGRIIADDMMVADLLRFAPNEEMTSMQLREQWLAQALTWGNGYCEIERDTIGRPTRLWLLRAENMKVGRSENGDLQYIYRSDHARPTYIPASDVLHLRGPGGDGYVGASVVSLARDSIGLGIAAEAFGSSFFGRGARPSGVLEHPGRLSDDARGRLRGDWERLHSGIDNASRVAILEEGMKWTTTAIPPDDAQFLETRRFQLEEIARWFNIPVSKLRATGGSTYSSLEQENQAFLSETLRPWLVRIEQEVRNKLLLPISSSYYVEHRVEGLLRTDLAARYSAYAIGRNWGWLSVNEIRALEQLDPIEGGDVFLQPLNMQPVSSMGGAQAPPADPTVAPVVVDPTALPAAPAAPAETNDLEAYASDAVIALALAMTEHQIPSCEHGSTNRCRVCGIERERELVPPSRPGGRHGWRIKWRPILPLRKTETERSMPAERRAKYDSIDFSPPAGVREEAARGLAWRAEYGRGGTEVGVARARDLSNGSNISPDTIGRMVSYFARHAVDSQGEGWSPGQDGFPSAGRIAWALWGGDPGQTWANKVAGQMDREDDNGA